VIVIMGQGKVKPEARADMLAAAQRMSELSMAEDGCLDYRFWLSATDPNLVLLLEQWRDQAAIDAHFATPHLAEFGAAMGSALDGEFDLKRLEVSSVGPLM